MCSFPIFKTFAAVARSYFHMRKKEFKKPPNLKKLVMDLVTLPCFLFFCQSFLNWKIFSYFLYSDSPWNHHLSSKKFETMWCFKCTFSISGNFSMERRNQSLFCKTEWSSKTNEVIQMLQVLDPLISADRAKRMWPTSFSLQNTTHKHLLSGEGKQIARKDWPHPKPGA